MPSFEFPWRNHMIINHNMSAMYSNRVLGVTNLAQAKDMEKLFSSMKINRA